MSTKIKEPPGPDQASGWLIAMACFSINFICAGLARTAGVLFVALIELYGVSREAASAPFTIRVCVRNMTGPLIGLLGLRYGIRAVTIVGGFVAALGCMLCYFAPNVMWITVFWGVIHGLGFGLGTVLHMMVIGLYFDKYKASALGLGYSGDCFGTFAFPVIMESLLSTYDVPGTFLILGGIVLHVVPLAMLLKKPPWLELDRTTGNFRNNSSRMQSGRENEAFENSTEYLGPHTDEINNRCLNEVSNDHPIYKNVVLRDRRVNCLKYESGSMSGSLRSNSNRSEVSDFIRENMGKGDYLPPVPEKDAKQGDEDNISGTFSIDSSDLPNGSKSGRTSRGVQHSDSLRRGSKDSIISSDIPNGTKSENKSGGVHHSDSMRKPRTDSVISKVAHEIVHRMRTASFASQAAQDGFICNLQQDQDQHKEVPIPEHDLPVVPRKDSYKQKCPSENGLGGKPQEDLEDGGSTSLQEDSILRTLLKTNTKPIFVLISLTMGVYAYLFVGVITIIIDYAADQGISQDRAKYLIIGFSITDLIGRLSFGQVIDRQLLKMKNYAGITTLLIGIFVSAIPLNKSFNFALVCMCLYGLVQGGTAIMFPILISCYMDKSEESVAMGCLNFYGGLLMLTLAPMIGFFRDKIGSYNGVFYILGGLMALIGIIWQFEPPILKYQNRKLHRKRAKFFLQESHSYI
ncbi:hypothetical protein JTE90_019104 [Oedothorax gibbosus]|uniref:Uncharacterized protein n=1 Tax=Oedothorax gibbosus TaxID=931172 RepID=A0AAV6V932_9ARAC|nr:hypothetical protein JTE90_019104 [Oedothorax gibbosus]